MSCSTARGYGPCVEAAIGGQVPEIGDGRAETRWPDYLPGFLAAGVLSSLAVPVPAAQLSAGLHVYAPTVAAFTEEDRQPVVRFADFAAVGLTNMDALQDARELAENLRKAMQFRSVIEQAKGILIERRKVTADEAFRLLAQASQRAKPESTGTVFDVHADWFSAPAHRGLSGQQGALPSISIGAVRGRPRRGRPRRRPEAPTAAVRTVRARARRRTTRL
jgi:ANTAR domain